MAIVFNSDAGTISGLSVGGLPDGIVDSDTLASGAGGVSGVTSSADANAITITSAERIGIGDTTPSAKLEVEAGSETAFTARATVANEYGAIFQSASTNSTPIADFRKSGGASQLQVLSDGRGLSQFTAKAWINFNGSGTVSIRDSHNISSVTDNSVGHFTCNFTNNMGNDGYFGTFSNNYDGPGWLGAFHTSSIQVINNHNGYQDPSRVTVLVFGD